MIVSFLFGAILTLICIAIGNNLLKIIVFLIGFLPIVAILLGFIPFSTPIQDATIQWGSERITALMMTFVNVVVPYLIGFILSSKGGQFVNNLDRQVRGRY